MPESSSMRWRSAATAHAARDAAIHAFAIILALGAAMVVLRHLAFLGIIRLTLRIMADVAADAFHRVQRFSTEWHANSFAGSTVRKISRGMWALDLLERHAAGRAASLGSRARRHRCWCSPSTGR